MKRIERMLEMQKKLDKEIEKAHNVEFDVFKLIGAIIDEIGELNHELKSEWCWWKKTQKPVDRDKLLEELVDLWHFGLIYNYRVEEIIENEESMIREAINFKKYSNTVREKYEAKSNDNYKLGGYLVLIEKIIDLLMGDADSTILFTLVQLTYYLDFTMDDVYEMYIYKNKINYERIKNNY